MKISPLKTYIPAITLGIASLASCTNPNNAAKRYMEYKPYAEFQEVTSTGNLAHTQSKLDSVAYKDLFLTTQAGKDSSNVAEYNKIAAKMKGYDPQGTNYLDIQDRIEQSSIKAGITTKEFNNIRRSREAWDAQYSADKWAYGNFFNKLGLMNDENFVKHFEDVAEKIKPTML